MSDQTEITLVLPLAARSRLEKERAEAEVEFREAYRQFIESGIQPAKGALEGLLVQYVHHVLFSFAQEALNSASDTWIVRRGIEERLHAVIDGAFMMAHPAVGRADQDTERAAFHSLARFIVTNSPQWLEMQRFLVERAGLETESVEAQEEAGQGEDIPPVLTPSVSVSPPTQVIPAQASTHEEIKRQRAALLSEYKKSTGDPSNRRIYGARNSGIHKPQFYDWRNGDLQDASETCINFERFLREKKAPIPRTAKPYP